MGLYFPQFDKLVLMPTLTKLSPEIPDSAVGRLLVAETLWHESDGLYNLAQVPWNGPGTGLCMYEEPTFMWITRAWLLEKKPALWQKFETIAVSWPEIAFEEVIWNLQLAVALCRVRYFVVKDPLPSLDDGIQARARYWGEHYQTQNDPWKISQYIKHAQAIPWGSAVGMV